MVALGPVNTETRVSPPTDHVSSCEVARFYLLHMCGLEFRFYTNYEHSTNITNKV